MADDPDMVAAVREILRARADALALDPASVTSPTPGAVTARLRNGSLIRLDVSTYTRSELTL